MIYKAKELLQHGLSSPREIGRVTRERIQESIGDLRKLPRNAAGTVGLVTFGVGVSVFHAIDGQVQKRRKIKDY